MMSRRHITAGQRFRDTRLTAFGTPCRTVWMVDHVWRAPDGLNYARLVHEGDPQHRKTLSTTALSDPRLFIPAAE
ncbi:MAG: hypothetical protein GEU87_18135 [Alphaproteobacteria bacterium]|nr:hypothetical protein [Alphaproteobacteria bacterium]